MKYKIGFIGAGNMAFALAKAIKKANLVKSLIASDVNDDRLEYVKKELKINVTKDNQEVVDKSDIIFLAVKPQVILQVLDGIDAKGKLVISIAAGVKLNKLESGLKGARVVRVMPNTPCLVGEMAAGFAIGKNAKDKDVRIVEEILNCAGRAFYLKESMLDSVTGLSGSGPAFVAWLIEGMVEGGIKSGLSKDIATELTLQTFLGTAKLLQESGMSVDELVKIVSSPGGTTVAGREILEKSDVKEILIETVKKATQRSKELSK
jgi:pyrroline-5-carboxylate reductase